MSNFAGVTFTKQAVSPSDDAIVRRALLSDGILTGCAFTYSGSTLTMAAGHLMICGRQIKHPASQNWAVVDATSGFARLVLTIDMTRTATKDTFDQVVDSIEYASAVDGFVSLEQSDINGSGTRYQIAACVVSLGAGGITGIVSQLERAEAGGSGGLNFSVVGSEAQPSGPKENMIWAITSEPVTAWIFAAEAPTDPVKGMLWIQTGTTSAVAFNAVKKNGIELYPISAKQYMGSSWVDVTCKTYQDGKWEDWWNGELYDTGNEFESITGGWAFSHDGQNTGSYMRLGSTTANSNENKYTQTRNAVSLAGRNSISVHFIAGRLQFSGSKLNIEAIDASGNVAASHTVLSGAQASISSMTGQLDVSGLNGTYYVRVAIYWDSSSNAANIEYCDFDEVLCR